MALKSFEAVSVQEGWAHLNLLTYTKIQYG